MKGRNTYWSEVEKMNLKQVIYLKEGKKIIIDSYDKLTISGEWIYITQKDDTTRHTKTSIPIYNILKIKEKINEGVI